MVDGKKLFLNLEVKVLRLLYPLPDGSNKMRAWSGCYGSLMMLTAFLIPVDPFNDEKDNACDGLGNVHHFVQSDHSLASE